MKPKFSKRYVLGVGYPWSPKSDDFSISLAFDYYSCAIPLKLPKFVKFADKCPKYRLVLERIK